MRVFNVSFGKMKVNVSNDRFEINCITFGIDYVIRHSTLVEAITAVRRVLLQSLYVSA